LTDLKHLADYVVYRVSHSNVGPWGLSEATEKRPMYLSPDLGVRVPIPEAASDELTHMISEIAADDDVTSASADLADRFPPPGAADSLRELTFTGIAQGRGLFGSSDVWTMGTTSDLTREFTSHRDDPARWSLPEPGATRTGTIELGNGRELAYAVRTFSAPGSSA
jgi:hypothetical protein